MYEKRLCILKQIKKGFSADGSQITGAIYAERLGKELILTPKIPALAPLREGRYALAFHAGGNDFVMELKGREPIRVPADFSIKDGFSALVCFVRGGVEPIAFGCCGTAPNDEKLLLRLFESDKAHAIQEPKKPIFEEEPPVEEECRDEIYNDEAIADSNYFGDVLETSENADADGKDPQQAQNAGDSVCPDEANESVHPFERVRGGLRYYNEIAPKLKQAMQKYPRDERLQETFPNSEWVKADNGLLGIIYFEGLPRYLCVAMKEPPPEAVKDASIFVPDSPYSDEEGYYIVFQDADSGEYVRVEES